MERKIHPTLSALSGLCAVFIGLGLCRFAYAPMVPAMVSQGWFSALDASYLIAINLLGYFIGAVWLRIYSQKYHPINLTRFALIVCTFCLFGRAIDLNLAWFIVLRFLVGFFGAVLVIITASYIVTTNAENQRFRVNSIIFTGLGLGITVAGILVAEFANTNVSVIWFCIAFICLIAAILCWIFLPNAATTEHIIVKSKSHFSRCVLYLTIAYSFVAAAFVPHLLFLVDYLTTQRGYFHEQASLIYAGLGFGAALGGLVSHQLARQFGVYCALLIAIILCIFLTLCIFSNSVFIISASSFLIGLLFTATIMLKSTRLLELDEPISHASHWSVMTIGFAIGQVMGTLIVIFLYHYLNRYSLSFVFASFSFFVSLIFVFFANKHEPLFKSRKQI